MDDRRTLWLYLPRPLRRLPADLAAMGIVTLLINIAVFVPVIRETPLRVPLGLAFVLFVPGYVFIAALFPEAGESPVAADEEATALETDESEDGQLWDRSLPRGIDGIERVTLSFGLSIAIVPLIGLALNFTPWGIRLGPIMVATTAFTLIAIGIAAWRRWQLPDDERFVVPYREWLETGRSEILEPETRTDGILNVLLVFSIILAVGTVTFAIVFPPQGEQFSAVYILTEDDDGELVADGYPTDFELGESQPITVGVDNHEHRTVDYTVVVAEQQVETENNETTVTDQRELDRFETQLEHNETWHHEHEIEPTFTGDDIRITWLLFPDDVEIPDEPTADDTEYDVHLWVNVTDGQG